MKLDVLLKPQTFIHSWIQAVAVEIIVPAFPAALQTQIIPYTCTGSVAAVYHAV